MSGKEIFLNVRLGFGVRNSKWEGKGRKTVAKMWMPNAGLGPVLNRGSRPVCHQEIWSYLLGTVPSGFSLFSMSSVLKKHAYSMGCILLYYIIFMLVMFRAPPGFSQGLQRVLLPFVYMPSLLGLALAFPWCCFGLTHSVKMSIRIAFIEEFTPSSEKEGTWSRDLCLSV